MSEPLSPADEAQVRATIAALEIVDGVVPEEAFPVLQSDALRDVVAQRLAGAGRVLLAREYRTVHGYVSGYDDPIADELVTRGIGVLPALDRIVLAVVLLRTVAAPRASGHHRSASWIAEGPGVSIEQLYENEYLKTKPIRRSVRRLKARRLLREGIHRTILPGPAMLRLTQVRSAGLWEDLILATDPDSLLAAAIRQRRESGAARRPTRYTKAVA